MWLLSIEKSPKGLQCLHVFTYCTSAFCTWKCGSLSFTLSHPPSFFFFFYCISVAVVLRIYCQCYSLLEPRYSLPSNCEFRFIVLLTVWCHRATARVVRCCARVVNILTVSFRHLPKPSTWGSFVRPFAVVVICDDSLFSR